MHYKNQRREALREYQRDLNKLKDAYSSQSDYIIADVDLWFFNNNY